MTMYTKILIQTENPAAVDSRLKRAQAELLRDYRPGKTTEYFRDMAGNYVVRVYKGYQFIYAMLVGMNGVKIMGEQ